MRARARPHATLTVSLPTDLHALLCRIADARRASLAETVRRCLRERVLQLAAEGEARAQREAQAEIERMRLAARLPEVPPAPSPAGPP